MAVTITQQNLRQAVQNPLTVVDFWAPWCGPCRMMAPVMRQLEQKYGDRIQFGRFNVQHQQALAEHYHVFSLPSLVIFEHGRAHEKVTGYYPLGALAKFLQKKLTEVGL